LQEARILVRELHLLVGARRPGAGALDDGEVDEAVARYLRVRRSRSIPRRHQTISQHAYVVIDGTLITIDRVALERPFYSGKHRRHGMNAQVISALDGEILWVSGPLPGAMHDLTVGRIWASSAS
jgi:hypothetical protein